MNRLMMLAPVALLGACATSNLEPPAELVDFAQSASFEREWSEGIGDLESDLRLGLVPASDGNNVYVADHDGSVYAFSLANGDKLWEHDTSDFRLWGDSTATRFSAGPAVSEGRVAIGALNGAVTTLDAATGEPLWQTNVDGELLSPPLMTAGLVVLRTTDGRVVALDAETGEIAWDTVRDVPVLTIRGLAEPAAGAGRVFAGFDNGRIAALSTDDGATLWESTIAIPGGESALEGIIDVDGALEVFGNELYATSYNGNVTALAVESGRILWQRELSSVSAPAVAFGNVYITDVDSVVHAYDRMAGTTAWSQDQLRARSLTGPAVLGDLVVVGDFDGYLHFLDVVSGEMVARISHGGEPIRARPLVVNDQLIVLSDDGELAVYRRTDTAE